MELLITLFLCGDVMTGRGIDVVLPHSVDPTLHEPVVTDARDYVRLTVQRTGPVQQPVSYDYVWGAALDVLKQADPAARIINLETAVTTSDAWDRDKGIHYRMHPANVPLLAAADIDVCVLANNHVLDWGRAGLRETLGTLRQADIRIAGAGADEDAAEAPALIELPNDVRVLVFAFAMSTSGVPRDWAATPRQPGVNFLPNLSEQSVARVAALVSAAKRPDRHDIIVFSVHWGGNWGYDVSAEQVRFAHQLVDEAGVDIVHGHSSHHPLGFEIYKGRPIFYGCGDFLNDYEGITGHESYRPDLALMYLPTLDPTTGRLHKLQLVPMQIRHLRLNRAGPADTRWLLERMNRESARFDTQLKLTDSGRLELAQAPGSGD